MSRVVKQMCRAYMFFVYSVSNQMCRALDFAWSSVVLILLTCTFYFISFSRNVDNKENKQQTSVVDKESSQLGRVTV